MVPRSAKIINRTVWLLSLVSLFTDFASEMLYPVMPVYLQKIGFSVLFIGILEGVAEATAGLSKGYFGGLSDRVGKRLVFVRLGYALSAISKPMMAFLTSVWWIFIARTTDRLGKGIRTGARDALLSAEAREQDRGAVFGFHRSMDTFGAVLGPAFALIYLYFYPEAYKHLFLLAFIPGMIAIGLTWLVREKKIMPVQNPRRISLIEAFHFWKTSPPGYRQLTGALLAFALVNSSDLLLLLRIRGSGYGDSTVIGLYIFYNLVYAFFAYPAGRLGDRIGLWRILLAGLFLFFLTYLGFSFDGDFLLYLVLLTLYGLYAAATEGISKALISRQVPQHQVATAIGSFTGFQSIASLAASSLAGFLWFRFGPAVAFLTTAFVTALVVIYLGLPARKWRIP